MTDPAQPAQHTIAGSSFEAGSEARCYLVTVSTTLHSPEAQRHQPIDRTTPRQAEAVDVAPAGFHAALAALITHRR